MRSLWLGILVGTMMLVACSDDDSDFSTRPSDGKESSFSSVEVSSSSMDKMSSSSAALSSTESTSSSNAGSSSSVLSSSAESSSSIEKEPSSSSVILSSSDVSAGSSSSSSTESSSSSVELFIDEDSSSSSVPLATPCKTETEDNCEYGEVKDERDGRKYKTVKIGEQWWMAENLNYAYLQPTATLDSSSFCYNQDSTKCDEFGRLYIWSAAMDSVGLFGEDGKGCGWHSDCSTADTVRGVCPEGWHLPSAAEFQILIDAVGGKDSAGLKLKSNANGIDSFGFSALLAGAMVKMLNMRFESLDDDTNFWTSSYDDRNLYMGVSDDDVVLYSNYADLGFSVRCVKD